MPDKAKDLTLAAALIGVGIAALIVVQTTTPEDSIQGAEALTFATLPTIYGVALVGLATLYFLGAAVGLLRDRRAARSQVATPKAVSAAEERVVVPARTVAVRTWATLALLITYATLLEVLPFFPITAAFLFMLFWLYGQRSPVKTGAVALLGGAAFYLLFIQILKLPI